MDQPERTGASERDAAEELDRRLAREAGLFALAVLAIVLLLYALR